MLRMLWNKESRILLLTIPRLRGDLLRSVALMSVGLGCAAVIAFMPQVYRVWAFVVLFFVLLPPAPFFYTARKRIAKSPQYKWLAFGCPASLYPDNDDEKHRIRNGYVKDRLEKMAKEFTEHVVMVESFDIALTSLREDYKKFLFDSQATITDVKQMGAFRYEKAHWLWKDAGLCKIHGAEERKAQQAKKSFLAFWDLCASIGILPEGFRDPKQLLGAENIR